MYREVACFGPVDRPFHSFAPLKEKHLRPIVDFFKRNLRSVPVLRKLLTEHVEFRMKRSLRYCGAISFKDLKTIILDSLDTSSSLVFHPRLSIKSACGQKSFSYRGAKLWNSQQTEVKKAKSLTQFVKSLKNHRP